MRVIVGVFSVLISHPFQLEYIENPLALLRAAHESRPQTYQRISRPQAEDQPPTIRGLFREPPAMNQGHIEYAPSVGKPLKQVFET